MQNLVVFLHFFILQNYAKPVINLKNPQDFFFFELSAQVTLTSISIHISFNFQAAREKSGTVLNRKQELNNSVQNVNTMKNTFNGEFITQILFIPSALQHTGWDLGKIKLKMGSIRCSLLCTEQMCETGSRRNRMG